MSNAVSALEGDIYDGIALVEDTGPRGMITVRADLGDAKVAAAVASVTGLDMPAQRGIAVDGALALAWMSPDEVLLVCGYAEADKMTRELDAALAGQHALVANVSDARSVIRVSGDGARDVIAKLCPVDMSVDSFQTGMIRRTRLAQVACAFWMSGEEAFDVVCFRSVSVYAFDSLCAAARPGTDVGVF